MGCKTLRGDKHSSLRSHKVGLASVQAGSTGAAGQQSNVLTELLKASQNALCGMRATSWVNTAQGSSLRRANKDKALQANPVQPLAGRFLNHLNAPQRVVCC